MAARLASNQESSWRGWNPAAGGPIDDVSSIRAQLSALDDLIAFADHRAGGAGRGFMALARSSGEAADIVDAGRLAIVPGIEVSSLGNWRTEADLDAQSGGDPEVARRLIDAHIGQLYGVGIRQVTALHLSNNAFGGTAISGRHQAAVNYYLTGEHLEVAPGDHLGVSFNLGQATFNDGGWLGGGFQEAIAFGNDSLTGKLNAGANGPRMATWSSRGGQVNIRGLTRYGEMLLDSLMARGMIIDIDHMSARTLEATLAVAEERRYPVLSSHTGFRSLQWDRSETDFSRHWSSEVNHSGATIDRIRDLGGMIAPILAQADLRKCNCRIPIDNNCVGSSRTFAQALAFAAERMGYQGFGIGSDINGMAQLPYPRFGPAAAEPLKSDAKRGGAREAARQVAAQRDLVSYGQDQVPGVGGILGRPRTGNRSFDINVDGYAHYGMLPDFLVDLERIGVDNTYLDTLFRSAHDYVEMWRICESANVSKTEGSSLLLSTGGSELGLAAVNSDLLLDGAGAASMEALLLLLLSGEHVSDSHLPI